MKRRLIAAIFAMLIMLAVPVRAMAARVLIPGGQVIGLELLDDTVTVAAYDDALGANAREAGLRIGDRILAINGTPTQCAGDVRGALESCRGEAEITVLRGSKQLTLRVAPQATQAGPRLGVYLRQGIAGIGTVTYYDPSDGSFGTLGHGVSDGAGTLIRMTGGNAYSAEVVGVKRGKSGEPGQLKGSAHGEAPVGALRKNTPQGVFGEMGRKEMEDGLPVATFDQVRPGPAVIRSTISGDRTREYSVEILKIYPRDRSDSRNFLIRVTDPDLLKATGGIVQGMSGSPIIQDGKLVGAVTHVLVNDPTRGYGIFIENMLDAAG